MPRVCVARKTHSMIFKTPYSVNFYEDYRSLRRELETEAGFRHQEFVVLFVPHSCHRSFIQNEGHIALLDNGNDITIY